MAKAQYVPPSGWVFCKGENSCGEVHYDGTKGGPKPTDELDCDSPASCEDDACDCKLCYTIKFRGHPKTFLLFPWTSKPMRSQVKEIEKDEKKRAKDQGLVVEAFGWECFCLKEKPITGKK